MKLLPPKTIEHVFSSTLLSCSPDTPLKQAGLMMQQAMCGAIVVVENEKVIGIWTESDALKIDFGNEYALNQPIREVMTSPVKSLPINTPFSEATVHFKRDKIRHYLVENAQGQTVGIISQTDIVLNQGAEFFLKLKTLETIPLHTPVFVAAETSLPVAVNMMRQQQLEAIIVTYQDHSHGIVTQRDILWHISAPIASPIRVGDIASRPFLTSPITSTLYQTRKLLAEKRLRHLGVTNSAGQLIALASFSDILTSIEQEYLHELQHALQERDEALTLSRQNQRLADKVFESAREGIVITDLHGTITAVNPAFTRITGWEKEEVVGQNPRVLRSGEQSPTFYQDMWQALLTDGSWEGEVVNRRKDGAHYIQHLTINAIRDEHGNITNFAGIFTDISLRKQTEKRLHYLANHDALTDLPNRILFQEKLALAIKNAEEHGSRLALMFLDLDRFKYVNDTLGHAVGDELLKIVATRLKRILRSNDIIARLGGDEFTVLLEDTPDLSTITHIAQRITSALAGNMTLADHEVYVTASIGISIYPEDGTHPNTLLMNADTAMYRAKEDGKNTFRFFTADMNVAAQARMRLENRLYQALKNQEIAVYYQPKFSIATGEIVGMEALLRWFSPELGSVSPAEFIPIAEESSLIIDLGKFVLDTATEQAKTWLTQGCLPGPIAVNLSHHQLRPENDIYPTLCECLARSQLPAQYLELELTESILMEAPEKTVKLLQKIRQLGITLSIDDFGTGYSSLSYLRHLPISMLKIDRSFVMGLEQNSDDEMITAAIISLAKNLGLQVVAEGVETASQLMYLKDYGCDFGQGYLKYRPMPAAELTPILQQHAAEYSHSS